MKCLYCDEEINKTSLYNIFFEEDLLCLNCRKKMKYHHQKFNIEGLEVESFYDYDSLFKDLLLQYKECYDEALKDIFLYKINNYINIKYHDYKTIYIPSTKSKIEERGFNHLNLIFDNLTLKQVKSLSMLEELSQFSKNYEERRKMVNNLIYKGEKLNKVLIIDDVFTTGSSLLGAYNALKGYTKKCRAIVLAKK